MTKFRLFVKFGFLLVCAFCVVHPTRASGQCTTGTQKVLTALNPIQIVSQIADIRTKDGVAVQGVQRCLAVRGCYAQDPKEIDGIVGPFTTAALYRSVYGGCLSTRPTKPLCGNGRDPYSFDLTSSDIKLLETPPAPEPNLEGADVPAVAPIADDTPSPMSQEMKDGLTSMQGIDYPNRDLFWNALSFFTTQKLNNGNVAVTKQAITDLNQELADNKPAILDQACKPHPPLDAGEGWLPDWNANMIYSLSSPVYGFYPFWVSDAAPANSSEPTPAESPKTSSSTTPKASPPAPQPPIDFGMFQRIGWTGVTFTQDGTLELDLIRRDTADISRQIEVARRFRTSVDLVVYKQLSPADWIDIAYGDSSQFVDTLSNSIADTVGQHQASFLNNMQYWVLPSLLASPTTAWDGVTLNLVNFPYSDPIAMKFLTNLLTHVRQALHEKEERKSAWGCAVHPLHLNLVVPFDVFVPSAAVSAADTAIQHDTAMRLGQFVPKSPSFLTKDTHCISETGTVDSFLVFLPQSNGTNNSEGTGVTKKQLRQAIEDAFDRSPYVLQLMKDDPSFHIAAWRYEMLRRITSILEPGTWNYQGDYTKPGGQFFDDMIYAEDNFGAVGFWPLPDYSPAPAKTAIAHDTRRIFSDEDLGWHSASANFCEKLIGIPAANFFGGWRRELAFAIELVFAGLVLYTICAFWIIPLRGFYHRRAWILYAIALIAVVLLILLCLFDSALRDFANFVFFGIVVISIGVLVARQYFLRKIEKDLP